MILFAIEQKGYVHVYSDNKELILKKKGHLHNYNTKYVAIQSDSESQTINIYNEKGMNICTYPNDLVGLSNTLGEII